MSETMNPTKAFDPYTHLHDENYHAAFSQPLITAEHMIFMGGRHTLSLDGKWLFSLDQYEEGLRRHWYKDETVPTSAWFEPRDYEPEGGQRLPVPSCFNLINAKWHYYEGATWFTRYFEYITTPDNTEKIFLRVGAAANSARVFLNGHFLGIHQGASTPFFVDITHTLQTGSNRLQLCVDNSRHDSDVPMSHTDWFNYGGIYREVSLIKVPQVFIQDFTIALVPNGQFNQLQVDIQLNETIDTEAVLYIAELGIQKSITIQGGKGQDCIQANPILWSPECPKLYRVQLQCLQDWVEDRVGFREIRVDHTKIILNGQPIWLRGISVHEEYPLTGKTTNENLTRRMLQDARDLGCNYLRLAHYPHHECVARLADELGFLLWAEIPVYWAIDFTNLNTLNNAKNQLAELIKRDYNRASVIIWSVGNENADTDERYHFMSILANQAKTLDPTRLVSAACLINREHFRIEDRLAQHLDVIGINEYFGWYEPDFTGLEKLLHHSQPDKPVLISETGADAVSGNHSLTSELYSEEHQADVYRQQIHYLSQTPYISGMTPWILYDFKTERRQNRYQQGYNLKGLIAADHQTRKLAFEVLATFYLQKKSENTL